MTGAVVAGIALALLASVALNGSYLVQHLGSQGAPDVSIRRPLATLRGLLRSRLWLLGGAAGLAGWGLHVGALSQAPLSLVQAFSAGGLALAVPLGARITRTRLADRERAAVVVMGLALATLGLGAGGAGHAASPLLAMLVYVTGCALVAGLLAAGRWGTRRPQALGVAAGVLYGAADAATKGATSAAHAGLAHGLLSPWTAIVLAASALAFFCLQRGLQLGQALAVIALMTAVTNIVAILAGLLVFAEPLGAGAPSAAGHAVALVVVGVAGWLLAGTQARIGADADAHTHVDAEHGVALAAA